MDCNIIIEVYNTQTDTREKASKWNTFWDEDGKVQGYQEYMKVEYRIEMKQVD